jgi:hypothetical protein
LTYDAAPLFDTSPLGIEPLPQVAQVPGRVIAG